MSVGVRCTRAARKTRIVTKVFEVDKISVSVYVALELPEKQGL